MSKWCSQRSHRSSANSVESFEKITVLVIGFACAVDCNRVLYCLRVHTYTLHTTKVSGLLNLWPSSFSDKRQGFNTTCNPVRAWVGARVFFCLACVCVCVSTRTHALILQGALEEARAAGWMGKLSCFVEPLPRLAKGSRLNRTCSLSAEDLQDRRRARFS